MVRSLSVDVKIEDVAVCRKKLSITISREEIDAKLNERFHELEREAVIPGFRPGRAPRRLIEKRFKDAVTEEVRAKLAAESLQKAYEEQKLDVIGEPDVDPDTIKMPDDGPMTFDVELEVRPEFELPEYTGIPVDVKQPEVTDKDVDQALQHLREQNGKLEEVPAGGEAQENDIVTGDLTIQSGDVMIVDRQGVRLPVAAIAVESIRLEVVPEMLKGAKAGDVKSAEITVPEDYIKESLRGKKAEVRIKLAKIERVALPDDAALLKEADYEDMESLKGAMRRQLLSQNDNTFRRLQEEAVQKWLMDAVKLDLPTDLSKRHANSLLQKQVMNLQYRGVPVEEIEKRLEDIKAASTEQAATDLKLHFILDKIAKKENIEATDAEVDARLRFIAAQYGRRDDRLREEMESEGTMDNLRSQIREDKVTRMLLEKAKVADAEPAQQPEAAEKAEGETPAPAKKKKKKAEGEVEST
jgi:trigger factor